MPSDKSTGRIRDQNSLGDVEARVCRCVDGGDDAVACHLHCTGLADDEDNTLVRSRVKATIGCHLNVRQALTKTEYFMETKKQNLPKHETKRQNGRKHRVEVDYTFSPHVACFCFDNVNNEANKQAALNDAHQRRTNWISNGK